ncbi:MAG: asparaginase [Firmicutes bacterium]|nr:asparaginase [Bacillota bacterium]MCM1401435.1 asparaginase [Bacteroides sp.]MCM1476793.1 asparaginase [Bacteroides sp.]
MNQNNSHRPRILLIYTGGTIGMIENADTKSLQPFDFDHLIDNVPKLKMLNYVIDNVSFNPPIDSSDMSPEHWEEIARVVEQHYDNYDGFVVLHGTDTMAYTASALSFMLENLRKPVIITGSQLPIGEVRTDGEENLITAVQIAAALDRHGAPMVQEVAILFENYLWRGNRSTKRSADNFNAFKSHNYPQLAKIGLDINFHEEALYRLKGDEPFRVNYGLDKRIVVIDLYPGMRAEVFRYALNMPDTKGVVLRSFGAGNAPTAPWFVNGLKDAVERGLVVFNVTQCVGGSVLPGLYAASDALAHAGVISGADITTEAAIAKMMFLFGQGLDAAEVAKRLPKSLRGEMTEATH